MIKLNFDKCIIILDGCYYRYSCLDKGQFNYIPRDNSHKLYWVDHITYMKVKISKGISIMYKVRRHLNKYSLKIYY